MKNNNLLKDRELHNRGIDPKTIDYSKVISKLAVEYINGCFLEHNFNLVTNTFFYTVLFPCGIKLDFKSKSVAVRNCKL